MKKGVSCLFRRGSDRREDLPSEKQARYTLLAFLANYNEICYNPIMIIKLLPLIFIFFTACHHEIDSTLPKIENKRLLFIGEYHDNYAHHLNQKQHIQALHEQGKKIAIGLEMFQRPFQRVLDDYIAGRIDEKTMLEKSEYFSRWGYDYKLYRPIMIYAKKNHIPLIALNLDKEITKKISKYGLSSLSKIEKKSIPKSLDFSDKAYKKRLLEVFNNPEHLQAMPKKYRPNPEYFYQAQILWDETMANTTAKYLKSHPDTTMIVLAGNGHLEYFVGIPNRVKRRIDVATSVILQDSEKADGKADIFLFPKHIMIEGTPKLGVNLAPKSLKVTSIVKGSLAEKLGVKEADTILALSDSAVKTLADLRLALYLYQSLKHTSLTVKRAGKRVILK